MKIKLLAAVLLLSVLFTACGIHTGTNDSGKISIVATNFAMYDFARAVAGDGCDVKMLIPAGSEAHDFEAALTDIAMISEADIFVCVGSEDWVDDAFLAMGDPGEDIAVVEAMDVVLHRGTDLVSAEACEIDDGHEHHHDHSMDMDEHVWLSIGNAKAIMSEIAEKIIEIDKSLEDGIADRINAYFARLDSIDAEIYSLAEMTDKKLVVADRFPFVYMTERYGFEYVAAFNGCSSDTEPTLSMINDLVKTVKDEDISAVFVIEMSDEKTARLISEETGCEILTLHSAQSITKDEFAAGLTFADMMEENLAVLKAAFGIGE